MVGCCPLFHFLNAYDQFLYSMSMNNTKLQNPGTRLLVIDIEAITGTLEVLKIRVGRGTMIILAIVPPYHHPGSNSPAIRFLG